MNKVKYYLDEEAYEYLTDWSETHKEATKYSAPFAKKSEVTLIGYEEFSLKAESKPYGYKYNLLDSVGLCIKGTIKPNTDDKTSDFVLEFDMVERIRWDKAYIHILQVFCTALLNANCFMYYGNLVDNKQYIAAGHNEDETKIITFRKFKDSVYAIPVGHHRSPEGVFQVRGHFRKYSDGKIIWIDSYLKGTGE